MNRCYTYRPQGALAQSGKRPAKPAQKGKTLFGVLSLFFSIAAIAVLIAGGFFSLRDLKSNNTTNQKAAKLVYEANHNINHSVPSTIAPTKSTFDSYTVGASQPRYIFIPKLGVQAIVRPLGLTDSGQLEAPYNVYDTGWFSSSAKPGQPGAMVVDGHVSSWTTHGVFYGLKTLGAGDSIKVERGDSSQVEYKVVKTITYDANYVDMQAVLSPVDKSKPGLNLITCTGTVAPGTSEFNKRIVVFAAQE